MRIAVNGRFLSRRVTGVERYAGEILARFGERPRLVRPGRMRHPASGHVWEQFSLPGQLKEGELLWSPANCGPLSVANQVLTLHDLSPIEHPEWFQPVFGLWYRLFVPPLARRVKHVVAPSEYVRDKIVQRLAVSPKRVSVAPGGVDLERFHPQANTPAGLPERYALFVGSLQARKNLKGLLHAWAQVSRQFPDTWLVAAGGSGPVFRPVSLPEKMERVHPLGYVAEAELPGLYAGALAFVLPSLDEGFGLPALEAMACGAPVVASAAGALPELMGDAGLSFKVGEPRELAAQLTRCLSDATLRQSLAEKGSERARAFGWEKSAGKIMEVFQLCSASPM